MFNRGFEEDERKWISPGPAFPSILGPLTFYLDPFVS